MTTNKNDLAGILYLINKAGKEGFPFRIRLQKMTLLAKMEFSFPFSFSYSSYLYGPYSPQLQGTIEELITLGFVKEDTIETPSNQCRYYYSITENGILALKETNLPKEEFEKLEKLWIKYKDFTTEAVVRMAKKISGIKSIDE